MNVPPPIIASNYRSIGKNTSVGRADLTVTKWRFTFKGCLWHREGEREWVNFPSMTATLAGSRRLRLPLFGRSPRSNRNASPPVRRPPQKRQGLPPVGPVGPALPNGDVADL